MLLEWLVVGFLFIVITVVILAIALWAGQNDRG
jgi:hypothetical protein